MSKQPSKPSLPDPASLLKQSEEVPYTLDAGDLVGQLAADTKALDTNDWVVVYDPLDDPLTIRHVLAAFSAISVRSRGGHWRISMGDVAEIIKTTLETHVAKEREARGLTEA